LEPLGDLDGAWQPVPVSSYGVIQIGPISIAAMALTTLGGLALAVMFAVLCPT
jgi:hypothetical protein